MKTKLIIISYLAFIVAGIAAYFGNKGLCMGSVIVMIVAVLTYVVVKADLKPHRQQDDDENIFLPKI